MYDTMIGIDHHGASMTGEVKFRKKIGRGQFLRFMEAQPPCVAVMESCGSAHFWARELVKFGHAVKLMLGFQVYNYRRDQETVTPGGQG
jgi:transposase